MGQITLNELNIGSDVSPDEAQRLVAMLRHHGHDVTYLAGRRGTFHRYRIPKPTWDYCLLEAVLLPEPSALGRRRQRRLAAPISPNVPARAKNHAKQTSTGF
jgi:hypothetical protein